MDNNSGSNHHNNMVSLADLVTTTVMQIEIASKITSGFGVIRATGRVRLCSVVPLVSSFIDWQVDNPTYTLAWFL
jgi:hypothetical protein